MSTGSQIPPNLQSLMSGAWATGVAPAFPGMPSMPTMAGISAMPGVATMVAPEAGWWWLPAVNPSAVQAAAARWFSPETDVSALAAADRRFRAPSWQAQPFFQATRDQYLRTAAYWRELVAHADLEEKERHRAKFFLEQMLDAVAPCNFFLTNPEAIERAIETKGESLKHGIENLQHDIEQGHIAMTDETVFKVGGNLALTPGEVVFRNDLIELLHYTPTQKTVHARPLLIVPPCINKFYILDLKPENSFVGHAVAEGFDTRYTSKPSATAWPTNEFSGLRSRM